MVIDDIVQELSALVGAEGFQTWGELDCAFQDQLSRAVMPGGAIAGVAFPKTSAELGAIMACASRSHWPVLPCGMGSKLHWGGLAQGIQLGISTARLNQVIDHAAGDMTVTVEAGLPFGQLQDHLSQANQHLALDPPYPQTTTIGGLIATACAGSWRHRYGGVRDMLLGVTVVRWDGQEAKAGGRVVKNVAGYDLMKLFTGSYGSLGIITQATFRVYPRPEVSQTLLLVGESGAIAQLLSLVLRSTLSPTAVDILSTQALQQLGLGTGEKGLLVQFQSIGESVDLQGDRLVQLAESLGVQWMAYTGESEPFLWKNLQEQILGVPPGPTISCKIGVMPGDGVNTLQYLDELMPSGALGLVHGGKGLGHIALDSAVITQEAVLTLRAYLQQRGGFLSILAAPLPWKQHLDVWGYGGDAADVMHRVKTQFDPQSVLSPCRFVNGI